MLFSLYFTLKVAKETTVRLNFRRDLFIVRHPVLNVLVVYKYTTTTIILTKNIVIIAKII